MAPNLAEVEAILRNRICVVCSARDVAGNCGLENPSSCALFALLPHVARAIAGIHSGAIEDYENAIRRNVCSICTEQAAGGSCELRQQVQCSLDAYLIPIVEVIEEATGATYDRPAIAAAVKQSTSGECNWNSLQTLSR